MRIRFLPREEAAHHVSQAIDRHDLCGAPGVCRHRRRDVAEKARRERLLHRLESADKAHPLELAKYSLE